MALPDILLLTARTANADTHPCELKSGCSRPGAAMGQIALGTGTFLGL
jgi:hypothetical protein